MNKDALRQMVINQNELNKSIAGDYWALGVTKEGRRINWARCCAMEGCETVDSYPWKHWKSLNGKIDTDNVNVELSDIWHFILSMVIEHELGLHLSKMNNIELKNLTGADIEKILMEDVMDSIIRTLSAEEYWNALLINDLADAELAEDNIGDRDTDVNEFPFIEAFVHIASGLSLKSTLRRSHESRISDIKDLIYIFHEICKRVNLDIIEIYYAKTELNKFRQLNGYKDGSYIKIWNVDGVKKEDNVVLLQLIASGVKVSDIIHELDKIYKNQL